MTKTRIDYPGTLINENDPEKHFHFQDLGMRDYYNDVIKRIPGLVEFEGKALHIGCGAAAFENLLCDRLEFAQFHGLEQSPVLLRIGEALSSRFGYANRIFLKLWENELLPFPDNEFDLVISLSSLHQWKKPEKTLTEVARVVKGDGTVFISDFRRDQLFMPFYFYARKIGAAFGKEIGQNLMAGFKASYTLPQVEELLKNLNLNGWKVEKDGRWFYMIRQPFGKGNPELSESASSRENEPGSA